MTTFNMHFVDRVKTMSIFEALPAQWSESYYFALGTYLTGLMDRVCASPISTAFKKSDYWWGSSPDQILANEVLVYFVLTPEQSFVHVKRPKYGLGSGGTTIWTKDGAISEIYVANAMLASLGQVSAFGNLVFHEIMHNKLRQEKPMHAQDGLAHEEPMFKSLNQKNISTMASALARATPQDKTYMK